MTRNAVEAPPIANRVVRTQKHSPDARGSEAVKFAKAMVSVQSSIGSVRGGTEDGHSDLETSVSKSTNDGLSHETNGRDLRFAPQLVRFAVDADTMPNFLLASSAHKPGVEDCARIESAAHDFFIDDRLELSVPQFRAMAEEAPESDGSFDPRTPEKHVVKQRVECASHRPRDFEINDSAQDTIAPDLLGGLDSADGTLQRAVFFPLGSVHKMKLIATSEIAGDLPRHLPDTGDKGRASHLHASSVSGSQVENRFDHMSVRVDVSRETALAIKGHEQDVEFTAMSQWDAASEPLRHDAAPRFDSTAEPGHEAASDGSASPASNENIAPTDLPVALRSGNSALTAITALTVSSRPASARTADHETSQLDHLKVEITSLASQPDTKESTDLAPVRLDFGVIPFVQAELRGSKPASVLQLGDRAVSASTSPDPAPRVVSAAERSYDVAAERVTQTPVVSKKTDHRGFSPLAFVAPDIKPALTGVVGSNRSLGLINEKSSADGAAPILTGPERLPPAADSPLPRSDWPTRIQSDSDGSFPSRHSRMQEMSHVVQADAFVEPKQHVMLAANAEQIESVETRRDKNENAFPSTRRDSSATGSIGNATIEEVSHNPPQADASAVSSSVRFSPLASYDSTQSAGQGTGGHTNGAQPHSLGQILSTLRLELSALKKADSSPLKQLKIRLHPESLGEVDVTLKKNGRGIEVQLEASLGSTASALQIAKDELASALAELGFDRPSLSIEVRASGQAESQHETLSGRDWQQAKPDIDPRNPAEQQSDRRRERKSDEGRYEEAERGSPANPIGPVSRGRRGIYV
ncbi:MAG: flagellar hook-length control protein FliK [Aestuariivirga sp.]